MKFALGTPGLILYPPIMSPWEPAAGGAEIIRIARRAEELGWDWLTVSEHIVMPQSMAEVMGPRFPEAMTACSVLAAATSRIELLPYVLVFGYRHPVFLAKQIATLDFLCPGRLVLGAGVGHLQREFEVLGAPFGDRGAMADEAIQVMRELWTNPQPRFEGKYFQVDDLAFEPRPAQCPKILIGGNSKPAMRRAARLGDGWLPWLVTREQLPDCLSYIREERARRARSGPFDVVMPIITLNVEDYSHRELGQSHRFPNKSEMMELIAAYREVGVTVIQVPPPRTAKIEQLLDWIEWFAAEIMSEFRT